MRILERRFLDIDTSSVHAATVAFFKNHPVFAWFGGTKEGSGDVAIRLHNLNNDNKTIIIGDRDIIPRWNPVLFSCGEELFLFEKLGFFCDRWASRLHCITDWDNNIKEKEINANAVILPSGLNGCVKSKSIFYNDLMLCGSSVENLIDWSSFCEVYKIPTRSNMFNFVGRSNPIYIKDKKTYLDLKTGQSRKTMGLIQPSIWINNDIAHSFFRSQCDTYKIYYSCSKEYPFLKWEDPIPTVFDNPNSGIDVVYSGGFLYLAYNPSKTNRYPLCIAKIDEDMQIVENMVINDKPLIENGSLEFSYPFLIKNENDGLLHLVYTYQRRKIEHCVISI